MDPIEFFVLMIGIIGTLAWVIPVIILAILALKIIISVAFFVGTIVINIGFGLYEFLSEGIELYVEGFHSKWGRLLSILVTLLAVLSVYTWINRGLFDCSLPFNVDVIKLICSVFMLFVTVYGAYEFVGVIVLVAIIGLLYAALSLILDWVIYSAYCFFDKYYYYEQDDESETNDYYEGNGYYEESEEAEEEFIEEEPAEEVTGYFAGCKSIDEIKKKYRSLAKKLHPDQGGSTADFAKLRAEYDECMFRFQMA